MLTARDAPSKRCLLDEPLLQNLPKHRKDKRMILANAILHFFFEGKQMLEIVRKWISKTKEARATHTIAKYSATPHGFMLALIQSIHWMSPYWYYLSHFILLCQRTINNNHHHGDLHRLLVTYQCFFDQYLHIVLQTIMAISLAWL